MLRKRLMGAALGLPMLFSLLWLNWYLRRHGEPDALPLLCLVLLIAAGSGWEVSYVVRHRCPAFTPLNGLLAAWFIPLCIHAVRLNLARPTELISPALLVINILPVLTLALLCVNLYYDLKIYRSRAVIANLIILLAGIYIGAAVSCVLELGYSFHHEMAAGFVFILVFALDTAAYFGGTFFRGPLLAPAISPRKTIAGSVSGLLAAVLFALAFKCVPSTAPVWWNLGAFLSWTQLACLGVAVGLLGQVGDLLESAFKRWGGVKDSGFIIYGHGGFLDRFDSLFLAAPACYLLLLLFLTGVK